MKANRFFPLVLWVMVTHDAFLEQIEAFPTRSGISATAFGREALRDPSFVGDLRKGRSPNLKVAQRVSEFMRDWQPAAEPAREVAA